MLEEVTPLILTFNESPNIDRTLHHLTWAKRIVVIDSCSTDTTLEILRSYLQVEIFYRDFDTFANQCNYGLEQINTEWILSLDADYLVTDELIAEIDALPKDSLLDGYFARFKYCVFGKPLRGTLLPPREVLFRREKGVYVDDGHAHRLRVNGKSAMLSSYIHHDDRKPLSRWLWAQDRYMIIETKKLLETPDNELTFGDRIRQQKILAPFVILFYCLILNKGILDGWAGWYYAFQRMLAEILLSIHLIETERLHKSSNQGKAYSANYPSAITEGS
ncbi:glycosyltransferase family 2 protein [Microcoleus sp. FACHB-SPT15]|uniref:glycosyltransferase family 2 protein n=1 Tax=Microcoleus sp. FACHB-SPT15 TaxID=2692830 RepID=UPI001784B715|nr:glycosyltransferase family 2 protein [Microcoleus sp. FACHB-SPT15]MBD1805043.1 glycosyltransferase family 2 protein [Microcoleus sp. FACHB-SPT15]